MICDFTDEEHDALILLLGYARGAAMQPGQALPAHPSVYVSILAKLGVVRPEQYLLPDEAASLSHRSGV